MKTSEKFIVSAIVAFALSSLFASGIVIYQALHPSSETQAFGSVPVGNDYIAYMASSTSATANTPIVLKTKAGSLGSVVVQTTSSGAILRLYDSAAATSSSATIASFPTSAGVGTYTFDQTINRGLVLEVPTGFNGIYTITYR